MDETNQSIYPSSNAPPDGGPDVTITSSFSMGSSSAEGISKISFIFMTIPFRFATRHKRDMKPRCCNEVLNILC